MSFRVADHDDDMAADDLSTPHDERRAVGIAEFHRLAVELNDIESTQDSELRERDRQMLLAPCAVNCFVSGATTIHNYPGYVRNISTAGVGVLTTRPMIRGEPVEVVVELNGSDPSTMYMGGLVAFCRHVRDGIYEVGVQLVARGSKPVLAHDAESPGDQLDWVCEALESAHGGDGTQRDAA